MTEPEQIADGWKVHDGGPCPVGPEDPVWCLLRSEKRPTFWEKARWLDDWGHDHACPDGDIIAYKPAGDSLVDQVEKYLIGYWDATAADCKPCAAEITQMVRDSLTPEIKP